MIPNYQQIMQPLLQQPPYPTVFNVGQISLVIMSVSVRLALLIP